MNLFRRNVLTRFFLYVLRVLCGEAFVSNSKRVDSNRVWHPKRDQS